MAVGHRLRGEEALLRPVGVVRGHRRLLLVSPAATDPACRGSAHSCPRCGRSYQAPRRNRAITSRKLAQRVLYSARRPPRRRFQRRTLGAQALAVDQTLRCRECGVDFIWTEGEQQFFSSKGLTNPPSRCPSCRAARKAAGMGGGGYGGGGGGRSGGPRQMYEVTCAGCGGIARVPFQPRGDKPVYCSDCFRTSAR
ncbi:MAG TPA: hypothetical protein DCX12_08350 [Chloroflexi bacterium]|nr:hypothetical protein [Chloroflexota bacterium]